MKKKCKSKKRYAEGGDMLGLISQLGSMTGDPLGMGISFGANALDSILELAKDPSDYVPQKVNSGGAYAKGGPVDPPLKYRKDFKGNPITTPLASSYVKRSMALDGQKAEQAYGPYYDLYRYYLGQPLKSNKLAKSQYKPTDSKDPKAEYVALNDKRFRDLVVDIYNKSDYWDWARAEKEGKSSIPVSGYVHDHPKVKEKGIYLTADKFKAYQENQHLRMPTNAIGNFMIGKGKDEKGEYISYYDKFDAGTGSNPQNMMGAAKGYEIYDRIYLDEYKGLVRDHSRHAEWRRIGDAVEKKLYESSQSPSPKQFGSKQLGAGMQGPSKFADGGYLDSAIGDHAFEVGGNAGVDTNARTVKGQDVLLTKGEIVRDEPEGAYVFSNSNRKMPHPLTGRSFSDTVKPIEKGIAKAKKSLRRDYTDSISRNTLGHLEQLIEQNKAREEEVRIQKEPTEVQEFARGGDISGLIAALDEARNIRGMSNIHPIAHQMTIDNRVKDYVNWNINKAPLDNKFSNTVYEPLVGPSRTSIYKSDINAPKQPAKYDPTMGLTFKKETPQSNTKIPYEYGYKDGPNTENTSEDLSSNMQYLTPEDKIFMGLKTGETIARMIEAGKPATQYRSEPYEIDRIKYNPQDVLDKNQSTYRALLETNTGNANLDRVIKSSFAGNKMSQDREALRQYANMQSQSDMQVNQYNSQVRQNVDNINEQIAARKYAAKDAAFSSVGNLASIFQQAGGARAHNKITLATLESLSRRYGINMDELKSYIGWGKGGTEDGLVKYKG